MRVLVLGAAVSGLAAARLARSVGDEPVVFDGRPGQGMELLGEGIAVVNGDWASDLLEGIDVVVASPGFSIRSGPCVDAFERGLPVWSELEYGSRHLRSEVVAVTGTNGKTTVTELTAAMLAGIEGGSIAAGNIGLALSDVAARSEHPAVVVVEASSFQLATIDRFHAGVAVFLNLAPDHLDWHGSFEAYARSKMRVFERQTPQDTLVFGADDMEVAARVRGATSRLVPVSGRRLPQGGAGRDGATLRFDDVEIALDLLSRNDEAYLVDVAAATVAATRMGAGPAAIEEAVAGFRPAAHRRESVASRAGIDYVNDSKATNPHAALAAVAAYPSVVLIAGGRNKGLDLAPLAAAPTLRRVVTLGEAAVELERAASVPTVRAGSMDEAVMLATAAAVPGDTVLLAPGCASFDMFEDYAERGDAFVQAVHRLLEAS